MSAYSTQWSAGQPWGVLNDGGEPLWNSLRPAAETAVIGFHSAMLRSGPGRVSAEMKAEEMKVSGNIQIRPALWATSTLRRHQAGQRAHPGHREREQQDHPESQCRRGESAVDPPAHQVAAADHHRQREHVHHQIGQRAAHQHRQPRHRQRAHPVDDALLQVVGQPDGGEGGVEGDGLGEDPGQQEFPVLAAAQRARRRCRRTGTRTSAAECVAVTSSVGTRRMVEQVPVRDDGAVAEHPHRRGDRPAADRSAAAVFSRVGRPGAARSHAHSSASLAPAPLRARRAAHVHAASLTFTT